MGALQVLYFLPLYGWGKATFLLRLSLLTCCLRPELRESRNVYFFGIPKWDGFPSLSKSIWYWDNGLEAIKTRSAVKCRLSWNWPLFHRNFTNQPILPSSQKNSSKHVASVKLCLFCVAELPASECQYKNDSCYTRWREFHKLENFVSQVLWWDLFKSIQWDRMFNYFNPCND